MNFEYDKKIAAPEGISFGSTQDGLIYWKHQFPFNKITSYSDSIITEDPRISLHRFNLAGPRLGKVFLYFYVGGVIGVSNMRTDNFENGVRRGLPSDEIYPDRNEDTRTDTRFISTLGTPVEVPSSDWHRKHGVYNDRFDEVVQDVENSYDPYSEMIDGYTLLALGDELLTTYNWNEYNNEGKLDKFADIFQQNFALKILPNLFAGFYELANWDYIGPDRDLWSFKAKFTKQLKQQIENGELIQ